MSNVWENKIDFLKGIGPQKALLLQSEVNIFTFEDLLNYKPFKYIDRSVIKDIYHITEEDDFVQLKGQFTSFQMTGFGAKKRLNASFSDSTGIIELVWFQGAQWVIKKLQKNVEYIIYGKPNLFNGKISISHPEIEIFTPAALERGLEPGYSTTEKLKRKYIDSKAIAKVVKVLLDSYAKDIKEIIPEYIIKNQQLISLSDAYQNIHFPKSYQLLEKAKERLAFNELFYKQFIQLKLKTDKKEHSSGFNFKKTPLLNKFYKEHLPFDLTNAQKRVLKEIYQDVNSSKQMNRMVQGDVGSGKTIVSFIAMLMAIDNDHQACLMAPTEILATQHYHGLKEFADKLNIQIALLTGSTPQRERKVLLENLKNGSLHILVGTHALIEDPVKFKSLGIAVIDEQHRFGVKQRAKLWNKNGSGTKPHVLIMTATPIPRTLAMTFFAELDLSIIDELPAGRKPIKTIHKFDKDRLRLLGFIDEQLALGRQIYIVYPLIEENEKLDLKDLNDGFNSLDRYFSPKGYVVDALHGKAKPSDKEFTMNRFAKNESHILVATTVIEVGVNVPNASVMVIENAERFGLSQLHQLRGRVGRGSEQSYCILMTKDRLSADGKKRIQTMCATNDGFKIAQVDLELRGPGDLLGIKQSGGLDFTHFDFEKHDYLIANTKNLIEKILRDDPLLIKQEHFILKIQLHKLENNEHYAFFGNIS